MLALPALELVLVELVLVELVLVVRAIQITPISEKFKSLLFEVRVIPDPHHLRY